VIAARRGTERGASPQPGAGGNGGSGCEVERGLRDSSPVTLSSRSPSWRPAEAGALNASTCAQNASYSSHSNAEEESSRRSSWQPAEVITKSPSRQPAKSPRKSPDSKSPRELPDLCLLDVLSPRLLADPEEVKRLKALILEATANLSRARELHRLQALQSASSDDSGGASSPVAFDEEAALDGRSVFRMFSEPLPVVSSSSEPGCFPIAEAGADDLSSTWGSTTSPPQPLASAVDLQMQAQALMRERLQQGSLPAQYACTVARPGGTELPCEFGAQRGA